ncbi:MAG: hypothetical protein CUN49_07935 [Candidatus Thermofonsia Clade 1 bacterium]|uniref:Uncharacterized protein n=1 Tax=Candidatus Thermofonsia Clade 1 bacterium TaxID=2364210 RepID=A0A2M8PEG5_9CHLR|nr:MAG: hypothetical protein CUN49_07935 [Candidatus Thermofonsia Clade 1 bacterium]RMF51395.1 MAG: hypothetical protein D6749_07910 [Chloroflexota bacterium]
MSAIEALDHVAARIVARYSNPSRKAYTYLFRLRLGAPLTALVPAVSDVIAAWVDEGSGLLPTEPHEAVARCQSAARIKPHTEPPHTLTPHQRKQMMARAIQFSLQPVAEDEIALHLVSRAIGFSPKGDREVVEAWRCTDDGTWYSVYREQERAE